MMAICKKANICNIVSSCSHGKIHPVERSCSKKCNNMHNVTDGICGVICTMDLCTHEGVNCVPVDSIDALPEKTTLQPEDVLVAPEVISGDAFICNNAYRCDREDCHHRFLHVPDATCKKDACAIGLSRCFPADHFDALPEKTVPEADDVLIE